MVVNQYQSAPDSRLCYTFISTNCYPTLEAKVDPGLLLRLINEQPISSQPIVCKEREITAALRKGDIGAAKRLYFSTIPYPDAGL